MSGPWSKYADQDDATVESGPWSKYGADSKPPLSNAETLAGTARSFAQGATFGTGDEIEAGLRTGVGLWGDYDQTLKDVRGQIADFRERAPIMSGTADLAGSVATIALPVGWAGRAGQLVTGSRLANMTSAPIRTLATEGAKVAGTHGALRGFGSGEDGAANRVMDAGAAGLTSAATGAVATPFIDRAIGLFNRGAKGVATARQELGGNPKDMANRELVRAFDEDGFSAAKAIDDFTPQAGKFKTALTTPDRVRESLKVYGDELAASGDDMAARRAMADHIEATYGGKRSTIEDQVRKVVNRYNEDNLVPVNVSELPGIGDRYANSTDLTTRAAHNRASTGASEFRTNVLARQEQINATIDDLISGVAGGRDADDLLTRIELANKAANNSAYGKLRKANPEIDVADVINEAYRKHASRPGGIGKKMRDVIEDVFKKRQNVDPETGDLGMVWFDPPRTLNDFLDVKLDIDDAIQRSMVSDGVRGQKATPLTVALEDFQKSLLRAVDDAVPDYAAARAAAAKGFSKQDAIKMAKDLTLRSNNRQRNALRKFRSLSDDEKDLARVHFAQNISEMLKNKGQTADVARLFETRSAEQALREILGDKAAGQVMQQITRAGAATRTFRNFSGSQTTPLREKMQEASLSSRLSEAANLIANPYRALELAGEYGEGVLRRKKDEELLRVLGVTTDNPATFFRTLEDIRELQQTIGPGNVAASQQLDDILANLRASFVRLAGPIGQQTGASNER